MKIVIVTKELKEGNPSYFANDEIGSYKLMEDNIKKLENVYDFIEPEIDIYNYRFGSIIFDADNNFYTKEVIEMTQAEKDNFLNTIG